MQSPNVTRVAMVRASIAGNNLEMSSGFTRNCDASDPLLRPTLPQPASPELSIARAGIAASRSSAETGIPPLSYKRNLRRISVSMTVARELYFSLRAACHWQKPEKVSVAFGMVAFEASKAAVASREVRALMHPGPLANDYAHLRRSCIRARMVASAGGRVAVRDFEGHLRGAGFRVRAPPTC